MKPWAFPALPWKFRSKAGSATMACDAIEKAFEKLMQQGAETARELNAITASGPAETQEETCAPSQAGELAEIQMNLL